MTKKLGYPPYRLGSQGGIQFLTSKKSMLNKYNQAKNLSYGKKVKTYHGRVAEAEFRNWLLSFLPKKFGITSGYVVSRGVSEYDKLEHAQYHVEIDLLDANIVKL